MQEIYKVGRVVAALVRLKKLGLLGVLAGVSQLAAAQAPAWQQALSGNDNQPAAGTSVARDVATDSTGNVFITGSFTGQVTFGNTLLTSAGTTDVFVAKWNTTTGTWLWAVRGGGSGSDYGTTIAVRGTNVYVAGDYFSNTGCSVAGTALAGAGLRDAFVAKYVDAGNSVANGWAVSGGGTGNDTSTGLAVSGTAVYATGAFASAANARFAGTVLAGAGSTDFYLVKYVDAGSTATNGWAVSGGGTGADGGNGVAASNGNVYVAGNFTTATAATIAGTLLAGAGMTDAFVAKYVDAGSTATNGWAVSNGGTSSDVGTAVAVAGASVYVTGNFYSGTNVRVAGSALAGAGGYDLYLAKYVDGGSTVTNGWAVSGGGTGTDGATGVAARGSEVYVTGGFSGGAATTIAGTVLLGVSNANVYVARYNDNGSTAGNGWAVGAGSGSGDTSNGVAVDGSGVYTALGTGYVNTFGAGTLRATRETALVGVQARGTGSWLQLGGPLQSSTSQVTGVATDASGNAFVTGIFTGTIAFGNTRLVSVNNFPDAFLAKWDAAAGTWAWAVSDGGESADFAYGVAVSGNSVYVAGDFGSGSNARIGGTVQNGAGGPDMFLVKYVDGGSFATPAWTVTGGGSSFDYGRAVAVSGNNIYLTGAYMTTINGTAANPTFAGTVLGGHTSYNVYVAKYVDLGTTVANGWALGAGGTGEDFGQAIAVNGPNVYVTGYYASGTGATFAGTTLNGLGMGDVFVAKYIDQGSSTANGWAVSGGGIYNDIGCGLAVSGPNVYVTGQMVSAAGAVFAGASLPGAGGVDLFLAKYTDQGGSAANGWAVSGGGSDIEMGLGVAVSGNSVYVAGKSFGTGTTTVAGTTRTGQGGYDVLVAKYFDNGTSAANGWAAWGGGSAEDIGRAVALANGTVYVAGSITPPATFGSLSRANPTGVQVNVLARLQDNAPVLATVAPTATAGSTSLTLTGVNLTGAASLTLTGAGGSVVVTSFVVNAAGTQLTGITVPTGNLPGPGPIAVTVTTASAGTSNSLTFDPGWPVPRVTGLTPASGVPGTRMALTGTALTGATAIQFTGAAGNVVTADFVVAPSGLGISNVVVPAGATTGPVSVTTAGGTSNGLLFERLLPPTISGLSATAGPVGTTVTITGTALGGTTGLSLGGVSISTFTVVSATAVTFVVPAGAGAGPIGLTTPGGTTSSPGSFCVQYAASVPAASRCGTGALTLTASGAPVGAAYHWYASATGGTALGSASSLVLPGLSATTTVYVAISTGTGALACEGPRAAAVATVAPLPAAPTITQAPSGTLSSSAATGNQWYLGGTAVPGATGATYVVPGAAQNGSYTVATTSAAGCASAFSAPVMVLLTAMAPQSLSHSVTIFPNPAQGTATLRLPAGLGPVGLTLLNALGQPVQAHTVAAGAADTAFTLDVAGLARGVYTVRLVAGASTATKRLVLK